MTAKWGVCLFNPDPEDLKDERWGNWHSCHGPFIVTEKGVFTDNFNVHHASEMFFYYCPWEYTPGKVVRKEFFRTKSTGKVERLEVAVRMFPLFLGEEVHPEVMQQMEKLGDFEVNKKYFQKAVDIAWEFAKQYK